MPRPSVAKQNFHVPLSPEVYERLRLEAQHLQRPATELARIAIESELQKLEAQRIYAEIRAYAEEMGGTLEDIDPDWQAANQFCIMPSNYNARQT
jgi:predicted DNA-binding protein